MREVGIRFLVLMLSGLMLLHNGCASTIAQQQPLPSTDEPEILYPMPTTKNDVDKPSPAQSLLQSKTPDSLLNPGDRFGDMLLTTGSGDRYSELWGYCDPFVTDPGIITRDCRIPAQDIFIGYGSITSSIQEMEES